MSRNFNNPQAADDLPLFGGPLDAEPPPESPPTPEQLALRELEEAICRFLRTRRYGSTAYGIAANLNINPADVPPRMVCLEREGRVSRVTGTQTTRTVWQIEPR